MTEEKKVLDTHREKVEPYLSSGGEFMSANEKLYVPQLTRGLGVLIRRFFKNLLAAPGEDECFTIEYPEKSVEYPPAFRGVHRLTKREDGSPKCVACYMCATACPSQCIYIVAQKHDDEHIEKAPKAFYIDELRCVYCGFCEEACPKDAIRLDTGKHPPSHLTREPLLWGKDMLLSNKGRDEKED
ncbi:MAG: NADH-quinone oxidoreductase subunit I [Myxococcota bacterium]